MADKTEYQSAFDAGLQSADICHVEDRPVAILPLGATVRDLEEFLPAPTRIRQSVTFEDVDSFLAYLKDFIEPRTRLFANESGASVKAILDYPTDVQPAWGSHTASLQLALSPEWQRWKGQDRKPLGQLAFAEYVEDNLPDIAEPAGAVLMEMVTSLEAHRSVVFKSGVTLQNGLVSLQYEEAEQGRSKGAVQVPREIVLAIPIYKRGPHLAARARLRYRITEAALTFTYLIDRPHVVVQEAFDAVCAAIQEATDLTVLHGTA